MRQNGRLAAAVSLCLGLTAFPCARAYADAQSDAKDLFERGRELRASGDCASAVPLFHKAYDIFPSALGPLRNAAECEESVGRWASAHRTWLDLRRALSMTQDVKYGGWEADAEAGARRVEPRVAHLTIDVSTGGHGTGGLEVTLNGEALPLPLVGTVLDRDPGKYVVRAHLASRSATGGAMASGEPAEQSFDLVTGETRVVRLSVAPPGQPLPSQPHALREPRQGGSSGWIPAGAVTLSLGVGVFIGMGVALGVRQDALSTLTQQCPTYTTTTCSPSLSPVVDRGNTASAAVSVLAVTGGILAGAGVLMLILGAVQPSSKRERVSLLLSPWGGALVGGFP